MTRRSIAAVAFFALALVGAGVGWHSRYIHPFRPRVSRIVVRLPRAHRALAGTTIAFVTDTHVGPHVSAANLAPVTRELQAIQPDLVLFGGDYISESPRFLAGAVQVFGEMAATARYGAWGIMGNHDLANIRSRVVEQLEGVGIRVLMNDAERVPTERGDLWIGGVDDAILGKVDLDATFQKVPPGAPLIALWHEPDLAEQAVPYGPFLQLSGHTHGGQVRFPFVGAIVLPVLGRRYIDGRHELGDMTLYVSRGIGMYRPPVRFNCPPELVIVMLVA